PCSAGRSSPSSSSRSRSRSSSASSERGRRHWPTCSGRRRTDMAEPDILCEGLVRIFAVADIEVQALQGLDLVVDKGELVALIGASGSGKSTLLSILSALDAPTAGQATVAGWDLPALSNRERVTYRRDVVGFVWQQTARNLLPYLSALENVQLARAIGGAARRDDGRAAELLELVGAADLA